MIVFHFLIIVFVTDSFEKIFVTCFFIYKYLRLFEHFTISKQDALICLFLISTHDYLFFFVKQIHT